MGAGHRVRRKRKREDAMRTGKDIAVRVADTQDSLEAWEADLRRIDEGLRCARVLAWAKAPMAAQKVLAKRLRGEMEQVLLEMCIGRRR